jgi:signal transduction histidine kinase
MTGFDLAQTIKERRKTADVPIIFLTAIYNQDEHVLMGYDTGAVDYIHKPVNATILRSKVAVFAELHRKRRQLTEANRSLLAEVSQRCRAEDQLRSLTHRIVHAQESEQARVALELHDNVSQRLLVALLRGQAVVDGLSDLDGSSGLEAKEFLALIRNTAGELERISHSLRPSTLREVGLVAVLRDTCTAFEERTGVSVEFDCTDSKERLPYDIELAIYRILQEALRNVEQHSSARHVSLSLARQDASVHLAIHDDGDGFDLMNLQARGGERRGLGLLSMQLRASDVGGVLEIKSVRRTGTSIMTRVPLPPSAPPAV